MPVAVAHECTPDLAHAHAGSIVGLSGNATAVYLRAVAVVAEGEHVEASDRPHRHGAWAVAADVDGMQDEIATILAKRPDAHSLLASDRGLDCDRTLFAGRLSGRRPSSNTK